MYVGLVRLVCTSPFMLFFIFMEAEIKADDGRSIPIMTMGPICIAPEYKRQGYGKILLDYGFQQAKALGAGAG